MARGSGAGLLRVPNIGGGPLFSITGNFSGPRAPTTTDTNINGGNNPYIFAPMYEAKGFSKWFFNIQLLGNASFSVGTTFGVWVMGTLRNTTALSPQTTLGWFTLSQEPYGANAPGGFNPMSLSGQTMDFDRPLYGITVVVNGLKTAAATDICEFYAEAFY